jgi:hypothetical protein
MKMYKTLVSLLAVFTLLDLSITKIGLSVGCVELNPFINNLGLDIWTIFRLLLLIYLITMYLTGYRICEYHSSKGLFLLKNSLWAIDIYIGAMVFSGILHILTTLLI